jgi:hypothetical protein
VRRPQLEHIIRAAAAITGAQEFIVIGSQAVLGQFPNPPEELIVSMEADLFTLRRPVDADLIDGSIGEASPFHRTFGYYARVVGPVLPAFRKAGSTGLYRFATKTPGAAPVSVLKSMMWQSQNLSPGAKKIWTLWGACCGAALPTLQSYVKG